MNAALEEEPQSAPEAQSQAEAGETAQMEDRQPPFPIVQKLLAQDPFLLYLNETGDWYHVRHGSGSDLQIHKERALPEPYPTERPILLQRAYRWLWMAGLGLLLAGLGAMVFATLAAAAALGLNSRSISRADRIRSLVILLLAGGLWLGGLLLGVIFLVHLI